MENWLNWPFLLEAMLLGVALAMDAFSVSLTNGLNEPEMSKGRICLIAGTFCAFQILMPLIGWLCVHTIAEQFAAFQGFIPWIALVLLLYIGIKMLLEGLHDRGDTQEKQTDYTRLALSALLVQGIATSIDALSTGFTIASLGFAAALTEALIIGGVTFVICVAGVILGKKIGTRLSGKASILGGIILICIGLKIFIEGVFIK